MICLEDITAGLALNGLEPAVIANFVSDVHIANGASLTALI